MRSSIFEIRDKAEASGRLVFDLDQLSNLASLPREQTRTYAARMVARGFGHRVIEGVISLTDDPFVIATQLVEPSYVSFETALHLHGLILQIPTMVECVTAVRSAKMPGLRIEYHRIAPHLFFGYNRVERQGSYVMLATPEKAALDLVYFGRRVDLDSRYERGRLVDYGRLFSASSSRRAKRVAKWVRENA